MLEVSLLIFSGSIVVSTFFLWRITGRLLRMCSVMETLLHEENPPSRATATDQA